MKQRKTITKEIIKIIVFLFLTLALLCIMQKESYAISNFFDYEVKYVDEFGNVIKTETGNQMSSSIGLATETFTIPVLPTFTEGGITYYVKSSVDQNLPTDITLSAARDELRVTVNWITYTGRVTYNLVCRDNRYPYVIKYEDESGNALITDQTGRAPDMTWIPLTNTEFVSTQYDAGVVYVVKQVQAYDTSSYQYNSANDIKVLVGANYPLYIIVCTRKYPSGSGTSTPGGGSGTSTPGGGSGTSTPGGGSGTSTPGGGSGTSTPGGGSGTSTPGGGSGTTTPGGGSGTTTPGGGSGTSTPGGGSGTTTPGGGSGTTTPGVVVIPGGTTGSGSTGKAERSHNSGSGRGVGHKVIGKGSSGIGTPIKQGWILENDNWYYYAGTNRDTLKKGWHLDPQDGRWYYLNLSDGVMFTGWHNIGEKWYFFNSYTSSWTWELRNGEWYFKHIENSRPLGSMYINEKTPDGFSVNQNGEYIR